jgi:hypothetical protein
VRSSSINANTDTYDTFVNLGLGLRLFDYTLDMRPLDPNGFLFDNLNFSNFRYGGDPNDVTRASTRTDGTTFGCCFSGTRISGITTYWQIR